MDQSERRIFLIRELLREEPRYRNVKVPSDAREQKDLLRSLMNVRMAAPVGEGFARVQDEYLREAIAEKGVVRLEDLTPLEGELYLWQGDITTLACDAIVNAANSGIPPAAQLHRQLYPHLCRCPAAPAVRGAHDGPGA